MTSMTIDRMTVSATATAQQAPARLSFKQRAAVWLGRFQASQMTHVLNSLSDHQLEKIGITRDEIPAYALKQLADG